MRKKKNNTANPTGSKVIESLKTLNRHLVMDGAECRKQIQQLRFQLDSLAAEREKLDGIEGQVLELLFAMAASTETERDLMKKVESAAAQLNTLNLRLLAVVREDLAVLKENRRSMEGAKIGKKWLFLVPIAAMATIFVATGLALWCRNSRVKN